MNRTIPREVSPVDIGWLAGIIDGEASITFNKKRAATKNTNQIVYSIHIVNCDPKLINKCMRIISQFDDGVGKEALKLYKKNYRPGAVKSNKPCYHIQVWRQGMLKNLLEAVLPHLTEKHLKAARLLHFLQDHKKGTWYRDKVDEYLNYTPVETERTALFDKAIEEMKLQSELHGNMQSTAEMTVPVS